MKEEIGGMEFSLLKDGIVYSFQHTDAVRGGKHLWRCIYRIVRCDLTSRRAGLPALDMMISFGSFISW